MEVRIEKPVELRSISSVLRQSKTVNLNQRRAQLENEINFKGSVDRKGASTMTCCLPVLY